MEAFGQICRTHETPLLRQALTLCGNVTLAEDLAEDTLVEAWRSLRRYNGRCQFFTWLCAILLNRYRNTLRKKGPMPISALGREDSRESQVGLEDVADDGATPDQAVELREQAALVRGCIEALPPKRQQVIYLRFFVDDSLQGIAAAAGATIRPGRGGPRVAGTFGSDPR